MHKILEAANAESDDMYAMERAEVAEVIKKCTEPDVFIKFSDWMTDNRSRFEWWVDFE